MAKSKNEKITDGMVHDLLTESKIDFMPNDSGIKEVSDALKSASKRGTGKHGMPEFTAKVGDFLIIIEDKFELSEHIKYTDDEETLDETTGANIKYAVNGTVSYAKHVLAKTSYDKIFAFGCSGDKKRHKITPVFIGKNGKVDFKILQNVDNFQNFTPANIERYYREQVLGEKPQEQIELEDILKKASELHESLRNYGALGETEKPLVVSAILLALSDEKNFKIADLTGDATRTDGDKIYSAVEAYLEKVKVSPRVKKDKVLAQFIIVKTNTKLNEIDKRLGETPLKYFTKYINDNVLHQVVKNSPEDVLGRFYGEFIKYSGGDGKGLGVVLTPRHITELFCDLADVKPDDIVFDPCCGTGGFLIAAMHRMLSAVKSDKDKLHIKQEQIFGVEIRPDMFAIATTNMILRGDGKSNLEAADFLEIRTSELKENHFTVGFMNPPYSQAKTKDTAHLSEINFIEHLLDSMQKNARVVVIVPQSTMVGKTKEDKAIKESILNHHTLEGVITLNKETFYRVGTNPCIAVFTAGVPHNPNKFVKFINYEDDGYAVNKHIGLVRTERATERHQKLMDVWRNGGDDETKFMVKAKNITADDEWLHSFYYFNDEIPTAADFEKTMADYLTFEFNMITHGRGYLFGMEDKDE
ncbi:MAG: SAM-dependent methyltransferase [Rickettsiales bacterium]|jgi:type I restriction-modification system DNA methylase subunit|nr:SAM-dependent methyltransferase [Rickettsiales bacterium]